MRLTAELVRNAPRYVNAIRERELSLRGFNIPAIENLGASQDHFETIDFSDNEIIDLEGFPQLRRLTTILANNNRITRIGNTLDQSIPNLQNLILTNNGLANLEDLDPLFKLPLVCLSLVGNPVAQVADYRLYVIHKLPKLRVLDFVKIKPKERQASARYWATVEEKRAESAPKKTTKKTFQGGIALSAARTQAQKKSIAQAIANATTLEEIERLEKLLASGSMP